VTESIFTVQVPTNGDLNDGVDYTLGTLFTTAVNGTVDGIRWRFPHTNPSSAVIGILYQFIDDSNGTELARATFSGSPTPDDWNTVNFAVPVSVTAGTKYVAAIWTPGQYVSTSNFFTVPLTNGDLTALADDAAAHNGRFIFSVGSPAYPTFSFNSSCYFADVLFTPGAGPTNITLDQASETDTARAMTVSETVLLGQASETDTARTLSVGETITLGQAAETDSARTLVISETLTLHTADEVDSARPLHIEGAGTGGCFTFGPASLDWQFGQPTLDWQFSDLILCPQGGCSCS
jgi:hypothetical protein